ncbi:DUF1176 domain-containing protein [Pyxidicoccus xibeiensis]|uniref:DUF1176 domain-containing protein n=1 Tax=Pyxidicoccus xibeiensis TaxID=2906759 RepID=UPI0020A7D766|nr:DUF1176 domain-containing protein [Pyxidicoccus xibeiensis]MCP3143843.1 DUF1176 domain-containing protein [Pyxidicoccus xibeiensis]
MHKQLPLLLCALLVPGLAATAVAATREDDKLPGLVFYHHDWELTCANTRTCWAAGYQADTGGTPPVSVLLKRDAGPGAAVTATLVLGDESSEALPDTPFKLKMRIDGKEVGDIVMKKSDTPDLSAQQTTALLAALRGSGTLEWSHGEQVWALSNKGATAVLLKMDEYQGRLDTPGALVRKGTKPESSVLPPLPPLVVRAPPLAKARPGDARLATDPALRKALLAVGECEKLAENPEAEISISRLTDKKLLASSECWLAAYNEGSGFWVINDKPPYAPQLVTDKGVEYDAGVISASHKGRGIGDCWGSKEWTWDGKRFVQTAETTTGMCRDIKPGGPWSLPRIVTQRR